jgi:predicted RNase H-like nuclease (RuvC/YqgF family)
MAVINAAKASGDLERLREIGENPEVYMAENGFAELDLSDLIEVESLERMLENLTELIKKIEGELEKFRESAEFILMEKVAVDESILREVFRERSGEAESEIEELEAESNRLESAKIELTGKGYEGANEFT